MCMFLFTERSCGMSPKWQKWICGWVFIFLLFVSGSVEGQNPKGNDSVYFGNMAFIPGSVYTAGLNVDMTLRECQKYMGDCERSWFTLSAPHQESIQSFYLDIFEVTQAEFEKVMRINPSWFKGPRLPVENVKWDEAVEYCRKVGKRLPTEWEWEYAAKGRSITVYYWGNIGKDAGEYAWYEKNSGDTTHPVGEKRPNGYGLYDMAGNVFEWTNGDWMDGNKVVRGGSWNSEPFLLRPSQRSYSGPESRIFAFTGYSIGFRCAR